MWEAEMLTPTAAWERQGQGGALRLYRIGFPFERTHNMS